MATWAKNANADRIASVTNDGTVEIYTSDSLVNGGAPLATFSNPSGAFKGIVSDGTNFFVTFNNLTGLAITTLAPSGGSYTRLSDYQTTTATYSNAFKYGDGYLILATGDTIRVFKLQNGVPLEVDFKDYFHKYYRVDAGVGYTHPNWDFFWDSTVVKRNNHTYIITTAYGLGDVYELPSSNSIAVTNQGSKGTVNPYAPAPGPFYGDPVGFIATTPASTAMTLSWNFGNTEASVSADPNIVPGATGAAVTHRYSGLTTLPATRTVTATNAADSSINAQVSVTLQKPTPRFGISSKYLFVQPNASSPAPIVYGDAFFDASDGSVESHYDTWTLDGVAANVVPAFLQSAGACGAHTLSFNAQYGPYSAPGVPLGSPLPFGISPFNYVVRPFAAGIDVTSDSSNVTFTGNVRTSANTNVISQPQASTLAYRWELLNGNQPVTAAGNPSGTVGGDGTVRFIVPRSIFTGTNYRAHLNVTSPNGIGATCAGMTSADAFTDLLNGPDPTIQASCTGANNTPPCSFTVASASGADISAWTYSWSTSPPTGVTAPTSSDKTYTPSFANAGPYTISATVSNAIGSKLVSTSITVPAPTCPAMAAGNNVFIDYRGNSGCSEYGGSCTSGEPLTFTAATFNYDYSCATHTFTWSFGDGQTASGSDKRTLTHSYSSGNYQVTLTITNPSQPQGVTMTQNVAVGGGVQPPPPPPPPPPPTPPTPTGCATMVGGVNVFFTYHNPSNSCTQSGGTCAAGEAITFTAAGFNYDFACANHTFTWNFGDGGTGSGQSVTHPFGSGGNYSVTLTITNPSQPGGATSTQPVSIGGGGPTPPTPPTPTGCPTMVANANVFFTYRNASNTCTQTGGSCAPGEAITFTATGFNYDFGCASHTFTWSFGDNGTASGQSVSHSFASGTYSVRLTISNPSQPGGVTVTQSVSVGSGAQPPPPSGSCGSLVPGSNVFVHYIGQQSGCTEVSTDCTTSESVTFTASGFGYDFNCATHGFQWDFGDGATANGRTVSHQYVTGGAFNLKLTITVNGVGFPVPQTVKVAGSGSNYPYAIGAQLIPGISNGYIFTAVKMTPGTNTATTYRWNFGDGKTDVTSIPQTSHIYADSKNYIVTLAVDGYPGSTQAYLVSRRRSAHP